MCPRCGADLVERQRSGVTIDVCVGCRGVWLDRGELEKLVALSGRESEEQARYQGPPAGDPRYGSGYPDERRPPDSDRRPYTKKKSSWLDIFD